jgi:prepilin-type N-terminal cleavage/methylation domain-containing protein
MTLLRRAGRSRGYSLMEIIIVVVIVGVLVAVAVSSLGSLRKKETLAAAAYQVRDDIVSMRALAVTALKPVRLSIVDSLHYKLQQYNGTAWVDYSGLKFMPASTSIRLTDVSTKAVSLEFQTNGLPNFNGMDPSPFLTVIINPSGDRKGIFISAAGLATIGTGLAGP